MPPRCRWSRAPIRPNTGLDLKQFFTKSAARRYEGEMLLAAAILALAPADPAPRSIGATAHAQAIIRIVSAVRVRFDQTRQDDVPPLRETVVRGQGPELLPAKLVEFE